MSNKKSEKHLSSTFRRKNGKKLMINANRNNHDDYNTVLAKLQKGTHIYNTLKFLIDNGSITNLDAVALDYNTRLSASIKELRDRHGVEITMLRIDNANGGWHGKYVLERN